MALFTTMAATDGAPIRKKPFLIYTKIDMKHVAIERVKQPTQA